MTATVTFYDYTGSGATTETEFYTGPFTSLMSTDAHEAGTTYQSNPITVPGSSSAYSYERIIRAKWTSTYNTISAVLFWKSAGTLSDAALIINAGTSASKATPVVTASSVATSAIPTTSGTALSVSVSGATPNTVSDYIYLQLVVPSTVTTPGDIGTQTCTLQYDEQ
ncbi:MAG: hypothetical protein WC451_02775 [Patescibacteria group bacterium]